MKSKLITFSLILAVSALPVSCQYEPVKPQEETVETEPPPEKTATGDLQTFLRNLPDVEPPTWDEKRATELVAFPLSCVDRLHKRTRDKGYLYERTYTLKQNHEDSLSFYGCSDWHSAVNSIWTLVKVVKDFPEMPIGRLIKEKLKNHMSKKSLEGELAFFKEAATIRFERPYGWAWLLKLYTELSSWEDPDAKEWAENLAPLAKLLAERTIEYLDHLAYPMRIGTHGNTAFSLTFMLEYAKAADDKKLEQAVLKRSKNFFAEDTNCPVGYEPSGSDFFSPCLAEAVLMSMVFNNEDYVEWFDEFMPPLGSPEFQPLSTSVEMKDSYLPELVSGVSTPEPVSVLGPSAEPETEPESEVESEAESDEAKLVGAKSHLIGLAFVRAGALKKIAASLPEDDPRRQAFIQIAALHGQNGFATMYEADYSGTHWLATYAVYMLSAGN